MEVSIQQFDKKETVIREKCPFCKNIGNVVIDKEDYFFDRKCLFCLMGWNKDKICPICNEKMSYKGDFIDYNKKKFEIYQCRCGKIQYIERFQPDEIIFLD